ncbi:unnamed protein product, partial [marine sediment metagenome]
NWNHPNLLEGLSDQFINKIKKNSKNIYILL